MVKSIARDKRHQIIGMVAARIPIKEVAQRFGVHRNTVSKLVGLHRRTGNVKISIANGEFIDFKEILKNNDPKDNNWIISKKGYFYFSITI